MEFKAKSVYECWTIIREETEKYQELMNNSSNREHVFYKGIRDALDRVAQRIMHGEKHESSRESR